MSVISLLLIVAASIVLILLVVVLVAQIKSNRHIETLKERVDTSKREAKKEVRKPKVMKGAQPSAKKAAPASGETAVAEAPKPAETVAPAEAVPPPIAAEEITAAESAEIAVEIPSPIEEVVEEAVEVPAEEIAVEIPAEVEVPAEAVEVEVPFEPRPYPEFNNARAVEQLGLSQEEADMFISELVTQIEEELPNLDAAKDANDLEKLEKVSHMLKGSATSLGEGGVADVLVDLNTYCKEGSDPRIIAEHLNNLHFYFERLKEKFAA